MTDIENTERAERIAANYREMHGLPETGPLTENVALERIAALMGEFVDNWPRPKRFETALALVAKTLRAAIAAGTRSAETNEDLVPSNGCRSGPKASPNPSSSEQDALREALDKLGECIFALPPDSETIPGTGNMSSPSMRPVADGPRANAIKAFQLVDCLFGGLQDALTASPKGQDHE
jgi:hypothetical protein